MDITKIRVDGVDYNIGGSGTSRVDYTEVDSDVQLIDSTIVSQALRKTVLLLTSSEKSQVLTNLGISNAKNITVSSSEPTQQDGVNGDIWMVYEE